MKHFVLVFHFYQPPTQNLAITQSILETCYMPFLRMLDGKKNIGVTFNVSGSLLEQLEKLQATEFFALVKKLIQDGKVELLNSAMYHSLLPITPSEIWEMQVQQNVEILQRLFGPVQISGFFPPELAVDEEHFNQLKSKFVIVHESAGIRKPIAKFKGKVILSANQVLIEICRSYPDLLKAEPFLKYIFDKFSEEELIVLPNDVELFGHHYTERLDFLSNLLDSGEVHYLTASQAISMFEKEAKVVTSLQLSTWQNQPALELWTKNELQKKYLEFARECSIAVQESNSLEVKQFLNKGWSSCYLYWMSNSPWWHPDLVIGGADSLIRSVRSSDVSFSKKIEFENEYSALTNQIWRYHWSTRVTEGFRNFDRKREQVLNSLPTFS